MHQSLLVCKVAGLGWLPALLEGQKAEGAVHMLINHTPALPVCLATPGPQGHSGCDSSLEISSECFISPSCDGLASRTLPEEQEKDSDFSLHKFDPIPTVLSSSFCN